jgi:hypothetical protein
MKSLRQILAMKRLLAISLLLVLRSRAGEYADVTAEIQMDEGLADGGTRYTVRCLVGTNSWQIEGAFPPNRTFTSWFTGGKVVEQDVLNQATFSAPAGTTWTSESASEDGNPGKPIRQKDLLTEQARIAWLAFCSGSFLKPEGRHIFPPSDLWKELGNAPSGFADRTIVFGDPLGLPRTMDIYTTNGQPIFQYRVTTSTNALGWEFPLHFRLAQYCPVYLPDVGRFATNGWQVQFTATGHVTSIRTTYAAGLPLVRSNGPTPAAAP